MADSGIALVSPAEAVHSASHARATASVQTPLLQKPRRTVHPNLSFATGVMRQWIVAEIPRGRSGDLPVQLPPDAKTFRLTLPASEALPSGIFAVSYFDTPVARPDEFPPAPEGMPNKSSYNELLPWCTAWIPTSAATSGTPPRSCLLLSDIHGVEYMRLTINNTRPIGTLYKFTDYMVPRMLGMDDLDPRALLTARKSSDSAAVGMRLAVQAVKRSVEVSPTDGCHGGFKHGCVPSSIAELGLLLRRYPALSSTVRTLNAAPPASIARDALDSLQLNMQILAAVSAAVDHHLPELKSVTRSKVENALQRQLRSAIAPSLDPGSGTCAHKDYNLAIVNAFHSIGRVCALCCSTWWSHSGALPEKPRLIQPSNSWNAHFYSDYASAYINWDHDALGYRSSEGTDLCDVRHKLDAALSQIKALCKIVDSFFPSAAAATGSGMLVEDFFSSGPSPPAPAAEGPDISLHLARAAAFRPPRGLALVTTMAMCLTVLHRESLWVHARLFPVFFHMARMPISRPQQSQQHSPLAALPVQVSSETVTAAALAATTAVTSSAAGATAGATSGATAGATSSTAITRFQNYDAPISPQVFLRPLSNGTGTPVALLQAPCSHAMADLCSAPQQEEVDISPPAPLSTSSMPSAASDQSLVTLALRLPVEATNVEGTKPVTGTLLHAPEVNVGFHSSGCPEAFQATSSESHDHSNAAQQTTGRAALHFPGPLAEIQGQDALASEMHEIGALRLREEASRHALTERLRSQESTIDAIRFEKDEMRRELETVRTRLSRERELAKSELAKARAEVKIANGKAVASEVEAARLRRDYDAALKSSEMARVAEKTIRKRLKAVGAALGDALAISAEAERVSLPTSVFAARTHHMSCADSTAISSLAAAVAEAATWRAERDSVAAYAAKLESELAETKRHARTALAALDLSVSPASVPGSTPNAHSLHTIDAPGRDAASTFSHLQTLRAEISAHKAAAVSSAAALTATTVALCTTRDELVHYLGLHTNAKAAINHAETRAEQAEHDAATAHVAQTTAQRIATEARQQLQAMTIERDEALESVRRITAVAAAHELRCSELQVATCEVCDMCVRQHEELAAARREAEASRHTLPVGSGVLEAVMHNQQQLEASRALVTTLQARVAALEAQLAAQTQRCVCLQVAVQELQPQFDESDVVAQSVMSVLGDFRDF